MGLITLLMRGILVKAPSKTNSLSPDADYSDEAQYQRAKVADFDADAGEDERADESRESARVSSFPAIAKTGTQLRPQMRAAKAPTAAQ